MPLPRHNPPVLRSIRGGFDLSSVIVGVIVVGILAAGTFAAVFGAIPWAQDRAAQHDLASLTVAEGAAKSVDGQYAGPALMKEFGYLGDDAGLDYAIADDASCYVGVTKAATGKTFHTVNGSDPEELTRETKPSCLQDDLEYSEISTGYYGACGISTGDLYCWGWNSSGHVGDGTTANRYRPVKVGGAIDGKTVVDVSASASHRCALDSDGLLYCWGYNENGEAGTGTKGQLRSPAAVQGVLAGRMVSTVSVGDTSTCAVSEKKLYCWGIGFGYESRTLGDAAGSSRSAVPVRIDSGALSGADISAVAVGSYHACALTAAGKAYCWGLGNYGQIGNGSTAAVNLLPAAVKMDGVAGGSFSDIAVGEGSTCAAGGGKVYCWGLGAAGQTGNGEIRTQPVPMEVGGTEIAGRTMTRVSLQGDQGCASDDRNVWLCWGGNSSGSLATGATSPVLYPGAFGTDTYEHLSVGFNMICALKDGAASCVGNNKYGGLGNGTTLDNFRPVRVLEPEGRPKSWVDIVLDGGQLP